MIIVRDKKMRLNHKNIFIGLFFGPIRSNFRTYVGLFFGLVGLFFGPIWIFFYHFIGLFSGLILYLPWV